MNILKKIFKKTPKATKESSTKRPWYTRVSTAMIATAIVIGTIFTASYTVYGVGGEAGGQGGSSGSGGGSATAQYDIEWFSKDNRNDCIAHPSNASDISGILSYLRAQGYTYFDEGAIRRSLQQAYTECVNNYKRMFEKDDCVPRVVAVGIAYTNGSNGKWMLTSHAGEGDFWINKWNSKWHTESDGKTYYSQNGQPYKNSDSFVNGNGKTLTSLALTNIAHDTIFRVVVLDPTQANNEYDAYVTIHKDSAMAKYTNGDSRFSTDGATFGVYKTRANAENDENRLETIEIKNGTASTKKYKMKGDDNKLYVRELSAPTCGNYVFDESNTSANITEVKCSNSGNNDVTISNNPLTYLVGVDKLITNTDTALVGAEMQLYYVKTNGERVSYATWTTDGNTRYIDCIPGNYVLVEDKAPNGYYKSYPVSFTVEEHQEGVVEVRMEDEPIKLKIDKINKSDNEEFVINAHLQIKATNGDVVNGLDWYTDGSESIIDTSNLTNNTSYYVHEENEAQGYYILESDILFQIPEYKPTETDDEGFIVINVEDTPIDYYVDKLDYETQGYVEGATLQLKDSNGTVLEEWVTDGTPHKLEKLNLQVGANYTIHEAKAPKGYYSMASDVAFTVDPIMRGRESHVYGYDYKIKYSVAKIDTNEEYVAGATLAVYDSAGNEVDRWITESGTHIMKDLVEGETYTVREIEAPAGYYRTDTPVTFTVQANSTAAQLEEYVVYFQDSPIEYSLQKTDRSGKTLIAQAEFTLKDSAGNALTTLTTSSSEATAIPKEFLKAGQTYTIEETQAPGGYYYTDEVVTFTVPSTVEEAKKVAKSNFTFTVKDDKIEYSVVKIDKETGETVSSAMLGLYSDEAGEDLIYSWETQDEPIKISDVVALVPEHTYYIREMNSPTGYYLNEGAVSFTVPRSAETQNTIKVTFENQPIRWHVKKVDTEGKTLTTAKDKTSFKLDIYDTNETDDIGDDTFIVTLDTSDKTYKAQGYFDMQDYINKGQVLGGHTYRVHEAEAASGYKLADDKLVKISLEGLTDTTITSEVEDEKFVVHLNKTDENGNVLTTYTNQSGVKEGFVLNVYNETKDNKLVYTLDTSDETYVKQGYVDISDYLNASDTYVVKEEKVPTGYYQAKPVTFTVNSLETDGDGISHITMLDPTIKVQFRKEDANGSWITKGYTEKDGVKTYYDMGFSFTIYDTKGTDDTSDDVKVGSIDTLTDAHDASGWINIGQYLQGGVKYRIHETFAPAPYSLQTKDVYFTTADYYNDKIGTVQNVKIGG